MSQSYRGRNGGSRSYRASTDKPRRAPARSRFTGLLVVLGLLVVAGAGIIYMMNPSTNTNANPGASATQTGGKTSNDKFVEGVYVDDIALGGLTRSQAQQQIKAKQDAFVAGNAVTVADGTQSWPFKISETDYTYDTQQVLDQALQAGRDGTDLSQNPVKLTTKITDNPSKLEQKVRELAAPYLKPAVDAAYTGIDPETHKLLFTPDQPGQQVDADALWASVKQAFESGTFGTVQIQVVPLAAKVTLAGLQASLQLITTNPTGTDSIDTANVGHTFTSTIKNHASQRLANIKLVGDAVTGMLMPGETLSVNDKTGPRTAAKGYKIAPVDVGGISDIGLGGGACQVSGTLFNGAIRYGGKYKSEDTAQPGLTIMERNVHSIPSAYMPKGTDATVDYGSKDLKIRNDFATPVIIVMYYEKDAKGKFWEHCDLYGPPLANGVTYNLKTKLVRTIPAKDGSRKQATNAVTPGTTETIPAHPGYVYDVFVETVAADGTTSQVKIYTDTYKADCIVIAWYKNDAEPTDTPTETDVPLTPTPSEPDTTPTPTENPTPTPTPSPTPAETPAG